MGWSSWLAEKAKFPPPLWKTLILEEDLRGMFFKGIWGVAVVVHHTTASQ